MCASIHFCSHAAVLQNQVLRCTPWISCSKQSSRSGYHKWTWHYSRKKKLFILNWHLGKMCRNLMEAGTKKDSQYSDDNKLKVWVCKWCHSSVANPHDLAAFQVNAKTPSPVCWFIISKENRLQTSRHWLFWSGVCLGNCSCSLEPWLCPWDSSGCRIGPSVSCDCKWCCGALWTELNPCQLLSVS